MLMDNAPQLLTIRETCDRLALSRASVYRLIDAGLLTRVKVSAKGGARITVESAARFAERGAA